MGGAVGKYETTKQGVNNKDLPGNQHFPQ